MVAPTTAAKLGSVQGHYTEYKSICEVLSYTDIYLLETE